MKMKEKVRKSLIVLLMALGMLGIKSTQAQVSVSFNINSQPLWGPANYDYVEYYYLPEADVYYNVPTREYVYFNHGEWISVSVLPAYYHIDLYRTYKVVINEQRPYMNHYKYKEKYSRYKHSYNKQSPNRDHHKNSKGNRPGPSRNSDNHEKKGKGHKGK